MNPHYMALAPAYALVTILWFTIYKVIGIPWNKKTNLNFQKPWLEFLYAVFAVAAILCIGQLYIHDLLVPNSNNNYYIDAINQLLIFSPTIFLLLIRKQPSITVWLPTSHILIRLFWGLTLALSSMVFYWLFRKDATSLVSIISNTFHLKNISHLVQIFMEDVTIALLFVRLSEWIGGKLTIGIIAFLFAAAHIPSLISHGATLNELMTLFIDAGIGVIILSAVSKSRDLWWFFMVHFVMDMTQFYGAK